MKPRAAGCLLFGKNKRIEVRAMPRERPPESLQAEQLYRQGMSLEEIAKEIGKPAGSVRRWKHTYGWDKEESERSEKKTSMVEKKANVRKKSEQTKKKAIADDVKSVMDNPDLTDKQRLFCLYYVRYFNATKAYQKAYGCSYETAMAEGCNATRNPKIRDEIMRLKQNRLSRELLDAEDLIQKYMDIAFADMNDFAEVDGLFVKAKKGIDGTIVSEVSATPNGVKIKLNDRMKALDWLAEHMDIASTSQRMQFERLKIDLLKAESDIKRNEPLAETSDDGFIDALEAAAKGVWADED